MRSPTRVPQAKRPKASIWFSTLFFAFIVGFLPLTPAAAINLNTAGTITSPSIETETTASAGLAALSIRAFAGSGPDTELKGSFGGAEAFINRVLVGRTPYVDESIPPGTYFITVMAAGYYPQEIVLVLAEKTRYKLIFSLERMTGFLDARVAPADADLFVDGHSVSPGLIELPTGSHRVLARRFAFSPLEYSVTIEDRITTPLSISLEEAPFSIGELTASRHAFNPANSGGLGKTSIGFETTSYGSGSLKILDSGGLVVFTSAFASFTTWKQGCEWNGRDGNGRPLPDGRYTVHLEALPAKVPAGSAEGPSFSREIVLTLDSKLIVEPFGITSASTGLFFFPEPRGMPMGTIGLEFSVWDNPLAAEAPAFEMGAAYSFKRATLSLAVGVEPSDDYLDTGAEAALSFIYSFLPIDSPFAAALFLRGGHGAAENPLVPGAVSGTSIEAAFPASISAGAFRFGLAPGLALDFPGSAAFWRLTLRSGIWCAGSIHRTGLSAELDFGGAEASFPSPAWPARLAFESRFMLDPAPLVLGLGLVLELEPDVDPRVKAGFTIGFVL